MGRALKVFGTTIMVSPLTAAFLELPSHVRQARAVVACTSRSAAARAFGISDYEARNHVSQTWNDIELARAMTAPGTVFVAPMHGKPGLFAKLDNGQTP